MKVETFPCPDCGEAIILPHVLCQTCICRQRDKLQAALDAERAKTQGFKLEISDLNNRWNKLALQTSTNRRGTAEQTGSVACPPLTLDPDQLDPTRVGPSGEDSDPDWKDVARAALRLRDTEVEILRTQLGEARSALQAAQQENEMLRFDWMAAKNEADLARCEYGRLRKELERLAALPVDTSPNAVESGLTVAYLKLQAQEALKGVAK